MGGVTYGVAKQAKLWAGRVADCQGGGAASMGIAAIDWVTVNGQRPAVVNMSLAYGDVQSIRDAVERSVAAGINYAVAAGNGDNVNHVPQDACRQSPAGTPSANTVGATDRTDKEGYFSNYGPCVDILAPGVQITSAYNGSDTATSTQDGTSVSTPFVTGVIAQYLQANPLATPAGDTRRGQQRPPGQCERGQDHAALPERLGGHAEPPALHRLLNATKRTTMVQRFRPRAPK